MKEKWIKPTITEWTFHRWCACHACLSILDAFNLEEFFV